MVLIELTDLNGTSFLYASATEDNPGPLTANTIRNETLGVTRRILTLNIPSGSNVSLSGRITKKKVEFGHMTISLIYVLISTLPYLDTILL